MVYFTSTGDMEGAFEAHLKRTIGKGWLTNPQLRVLAESEEAKTFIETRERITAARPVKFLGDGTKVRLPAPKDEAAKIELAERTFKEKIAETLGVDLPTLEQQITLHKFKTRNSYSDLVNVAQGKWGTPGAVIELGLR